MFLSYFKLCFVHPYILVEMLKKYFSVHAKGMDWNICLPVVNGFSFYKLYIQDWIPVPAALLMVIQCKIKTHIHIRPGVAATTDQLQPLCFVKGFLDNKRGWSCDQNMITGWCSSVMGSTEKCQKSLWKCSVCCFYCMLLLYYVLFIYYLNSLVSKNQSLSK